MIRLMTIAALLCLGPLAAGLPPAAQAQGLPSVDQTIATGDTIDEIIRRQQAAERAARSNEIDGEDGIYVLRVNEIFFVAGSSDIGYMSNPLRNENDVGGSSYASLLTSAGVQTRLAETLDAGLSLTLSGTEFAEDFAPSSRSVSTALTVGRELPGMPIYVSASAFGGFSFDKSFGNQVGFYGAAFSASTAMQWDDRTVFRAGVGANMQLSDVRENDNLSVSASASVTHALTERLAVTMDVRVTQSKFDDFFEDVTFIEREDTTYAASIRADFALSESVSLGATVGYEERSSSFFLSNYTNSEGSLMLTARARF